MGVKEVSGEVDIPMIDGEIYKQLDHEYGQGCIKGDTGRMIQKNILRDCALAKRFHLKKILKEKQLEKEKLIQVKSELLSEGDDDNEENEEQDNGMYEEGDEEEGDEEEGDKEEGDKEEGDKEEGDKLEGD